MYELLLVGLILGSVLPGWAGDKEQLSSPFANMGIVRILNVRNKEVDQECLFSGVKAIVDQFDEKRLIPYKVKIWKDHPVVKETLSGEMIIFSRDPDKGDSLSILIPLKYKGNRIIVHKKHDRTESYEMFGLPDGVSEIDFSACFK